MSGVLFLIVMDQVMTRTICHDEIGISWNFTSKLDDLDFADDVVLKSSTKQQIQDKTAGTDDEARPVGLKITMEKTKVMRINAKNQEIIMIAGKGIAEADEFIYLGATVSEEEGGMKDLKNGLSRVRRAFVRLKRIWHGAEKTS